MTSASTVGIHGLWMPYCRAREAPTPYQSGTVPGICHRPRAGEVGSHGNTDGEPAGPAPRRVGGHVAPSFGDPVVSSRAEPSRVEGGGVPLDIGVAGGQLVSAQGQSVVWAGRCVVMEPDIGDGDRARPGSERRQVLPEPRRAPALMYHQVPPCPRVGPPERAPPCLGRVALLYTPAGWCCG